MWMQKMAVVAGWMVAGLIAASGSLWAHHSDAVYDMTHITIIKGTITEHQFINPHQIIRMKAKDSAGRVTPWMLVGDSVAATRASGWTRETLKPGDEVMVWGFAYRDGKANMTWNRIVKADGKLLPVPGGAKADKLARYLAVYGKEQLSIEDYELFKQQVQNSTRFQGE